MLMHQTHYRWLFAENAVPAGLWALLFIACAVTEGSREGSTQVIRIGFIIKGTEDQT